MSDSTIIFERIINRTTKEFAINEQGNELHIIATDNVIT